MHARECRREIDGSGICQLQEPALGSRESVTGPGIFLEETRESGGKIRQCGRVSSGAECPEPQASAPGTPARRVPPSEYCASLTRCRVSSSDANSPAESSPRPLNRG